MDEGQRKGAAKGKERVSKKRDKEKARDHSMGDVIHVGDHTSVEIALKEK